MYGCNMADRVVDQFTTKPTNGNNGINKLAEGILKERLLPWIMSKRVSV